MINGHQSQGNIISGKMTWQNKQRDQAEGSVIVQSSQNFYCSLYNGVIRTELFLRTPRKKLKTMPRFASKIGAILKGKNLLPILSFKSSPYGKEETFLYVNDTNSSPYI